VKICPVPIDKRLVEYFESLVPKLSITPASNLSEIQFSAGRLSVIELIKQEHKKQEKQ
jgi:hypothetical protein